MDENGNLTTYNYAYSYNSTTDNLGITGPDGSTMVYVGYMPVRSAT